MPPLTGREAPYQVALVATILELLAVLALSPRGLGADANGVATVVGVRAAAMVLLAVLVRDAAPRHAWPALLVWAAITWPPELWMASLSAAPVPLPSAAGALVLGLGVHGAARLVPAAWWAMPAVLVGSAFAPGHWGPLGALLGSSPPVWLAVAAVVAAAAWVREERRAARG